MRSVPSLSSAFKDHYFSLVTSAPEEAWEPYCSRKPSSTCLLLFVRPIRPPRRFALAPPCCFYSHSAPLLLILSLSLRLRFSVYTGWRATCRSRATLRFSYNSMEIVRVSEIVATNGFYGVECCDVEYIYYVRRNVFTALDIFIRGKVEKYVFDWFVRIEEFFLLLFPSTSDIPLLSDTLHFAYKKSFEIKHLKQTWSK